MSGWHAETPYKVTQEFPNRLVCESHLPSLWQFSIFSQNLSPTCHWPEEGDGMKHELHSLIHHWPCVFRKCCLTSCDCFFFIRSRLKKPSLRYHLYQYLGVERSDRFETQWPPHYDCWVLRHACATDEPPRHWAGCHSAQIIPLRPFIIFS